MIGAAEGSEGLQEEPGDNPKSAEGESFLEVETMFICCK